MEIWAKVTSEFNSGIYIKELPNPIRLNYILNVGEVIEIAGCNYIVVKRLLNSYDDTAKYLPFVELILVPSIEDSKQGYSKLYAKVSINFFMGERSSWCEKNKIIIENENKIESFITAVIPNSERDYIKVKDGEQHIEDDLYCEFKSIRSVINPAGVLKSSINVCNNKITKRDLINFN
jgi:hypothetical protein